MHVLATKGCDSHVELYTPTNYSDLDVEMNKVRVRTKKVYNTKL